MRHLTRSLIVSLVVFTMFIVPPLAVLRPALLVPLAAKPGRPPPGLSVLVSWFGSQSSFFTGGLFGWCVGVLIPLGFSFHFKLTSGVPRAGSARLAGLLQDLALTCVSLSANLGHLSGLLGPW